MNYFEYFASKAVRGRFGLMRLAAGEPGSLCTMFAFEGVDDPNILHCTHKYFGEGTASKAQVIKELEAHFGAEPFKPFKPKFTKLAQFGPAKDYRVLRPEDDKAFLPALKGKLDELEADKWPEYQPHVTVGRNTDELHVGIRDYVLMENHKQVWSASAMQHKLRKETAEFFNKARRT